MPTTWDLVRTTQNISVLDHSATMAGWRGWTKFSGGWTKTCFKTCVPQANKEIKIERKNCQKLNGQKEKVERDVRDEDKP